MKQPAFQFYTGDWLKDPALSKCAPATRGIWIDAVCAMHEMDHCGELRGTSEQLARILRCSPAEVEAAIADLKANDAADVTVTSAQISCDMSQKCHALSQIVTLSCRRMKREYKIRKEATLRQQKHRVSRVVTEKSRLHSSSSSSSSSPQAPQGGGDDDGPPEEIQGPPEPPQSKPDSPRQAVPVPPLRATDDPLDSDIRGWIGGHPSLMWDAKGHAKLRKLVEGVGWADAAERVNSAVASGKACPIGYALSVWAGEQSEAALKGRRDRPKPAVALNVTKDW